MEKKTIIGIIIAVIAVLAVGAGVLYFLNRPQDNASNNASNNQPNNTTNGAAKVEGDKTLIVYYSAQNHTKAVAEQIADNLGADTFEIVPVNVYTAEDLDWTADDSRVNREHEDVTLREIELENTQVANWDQYDTILIGYPIWWGIAAWPVNTFIKANNFTGKTVIPFCTSASSGLGQSGQLLADEAGTGNWLTGHRFSSNPSSSDIKAWTDSLK